MQQVLIVVFTSAYWLSWIAIGWGGLLFFSRIFSLRFMKLPLPFRLLASLALGFFIWLIISLFLYLFRAPIWIAGIGYLILFITTATYLGREFYTNRKQYHPFFPKMKWPLILLLVIIALDYIISIYIGSTLQSGGDAYIHIGRIHVMSIEGYTLATPYSQFSIDANYHFNLIYSLYQPLLYITNVDAIEAWRFSSSFFRAINWLCIFTIATILSHEVIKNTRQRANFGAFVTIFSIIAFGHVFIYSAYPSQVAVVWIYTLVLSLIVSLKYRKEGLIGVIVSSILITFSHPSYALMAASILLSTFILIFIFAKKNINKLNSLVYITSLMITLIGPGIAYLLSGPLTTAQSEIAQNTYQTIGLITLRRFDLLIPSGPVAVILSVGAIVGTLYLIVHSWKVNKALFAIITPPLILWFVIMYFPGVLNILLLKLPPWLIGRFDAINVFQYVLPFIGFWWMVKKVVSTKWQVTVWVLFSTALSLASLSGHLNVYGDTKLSNAVHYANAYQLDELLPADNNARLDILAQPEVGYQTMAVRRVNLLDVGEGHTVPRAKPTARHECRERLLSTAQYTGGVLGEDYLLWIAQDTPKKSGYSTKNEVNVGGFWLADVMPQSKSDNVNGSCKLLEDSVFIKDK